MTPAGEGHPNSLHPSGFPADFRDFIRELNAYRVEFLLVGGYAVGYYGHVRATADIDFLYRCTKRNIGRLIHALAAFGAPSVVMDPIHLANPNGMSAFGEPPHRIDLLAGISGVSFDEALVQAAVLDLDGDALPIIGLEALRRNKQASGRRKDRDDLERLPSGG
jgi:hypothetical protein